jgi:hypothetical protein
LIPRKTWTLLNPNVTLIKYANENCGIFEEYEY